MNHTKDNIRKIVEDYSKNNAQEFEMLKDIVVMKRAAYAEGFEKGTDMRPLYELTETLHSLLVEKLEEDEMRWFKTKQGAHWFIKEYKIFAL